MRKLLSALLGLLLAGVSLPAAKAQTVPDPALWAEINRIRAIDNHGHPMRLVTGAETDNDSNDWIPVEPLDMPVRLRPDNPEHIAAWRALFGYRHNDMSEAHLRELMDTRQRVRRERGDAYPAWVLDQLGIEVMLTNRVTMGRGLTAPRFRWVPFDDALIFPLNNEGGSRAAPDRRAYFAGMGRILRLYLTESRVNTLPATLNEYLSRVVTATLERQKAAGALAIKFSAAYGRSLDFAAVPQEKAQQIYARYARGGEPPAAEYKALQDFLFRYIAREAGRLGMVMHIHVGGGASGSFNQTGASPFLLEPVLNDPTLRGTKFVLLHGGMPFGSETRALIYKPNVYAEFSGQTFLLSTRGLSEVLRSWLEFVPEKVLFGSDAFEITPAVGWEELGWLTTTSARQALAIALTGMMNDGQITRERALELARMVMRDNAARLYGIRTE